MLAVAGLFGSLVSGLYITSRETLDRNRVARRNRAYVEAFRLGNTEEMSPAEIGQLVEQQIVIREQALPGEQQDGSMTIVEAYENPERTRLKGVGFRFRGSGFWAPIEGILALTPDGRKTLGLFILQQQETPGLGGRIEEQIFIGEFEAGVDVSVPEEAAKYLQISQTAPQAGTAMEGRHVDAITGATQTCMAMERILNNHLRRFKRVRTASTENEAGE